MASSRRYNEIVDKFEFLIRKIYTISGGALYSPLETPCIYFFIKFWICFFPFILPVSPILFVGCVCTYFQRTEVNKYQLIYTNLPSNQNTKREALTVNPVLSVALCNSTSTPPRMHAAAADGGDTKR